MIFIHRILSKMFGNYKVQRQFLLSFLFIIALPLLAISLFLLVLSTQELKERYLEQIDADNVRVRSIMLDATMNAYNIAEKLSSDPELLTLLNRNYETIRDKIQYLDGYKGLDKALANTASISHLAIYTPNETIGNYSYYQTFSSQDKNSSWYGKAQKSAAPFWQIHLRSDIHSNLHWELTLYRRLPLIQSGEFAVLQIGMSDNYLRNRIENTDFTTYISVNRDPMFYSSDRVSRGNTVPFKLDYSKAFLHENDILQLSDGSSHIGSVSTLAPYLSEDQLYIISLNQSALGTIRSTTFHYALLVLACFLVPCLLFILFSHYFSTRVITLRNAMHQAGNGDYDIIDHFQGNDELTEAFLYLQQMIADIQQKEALVYQAELNEQKLLNQQQQMEFKMLASQINPHFLYNTLETIRMKAFTAGNREVAQAIKLLGKSLRYVLENTGTASTTLDKELSYIETYLSIQKIRFGDRVSYSIDTQPGLNLSEYQILPLLLQPIVENAFSHGLESTEENGKIRVSIKEEADALLCITISDNGIGMTKEELEQLRTRVHTMDMTRTRSIGLSNINQRIRLRYGPEYGIHFISEPGQGTSVILKLPLEKLE